MTKRFRSLQEIIKDHKPKLKRLQEATTRLVFDTINVDYISTYELFLVRLYDVVQNGKLSEERLKGLLSILQGKSTIKDERTQVADENDTAGSFTEQTTPTEHLDAAYQFLVPPEKLEEVKESKWIPRSLAARLYMRYEQIARIPKMLQDYGSYSFALYLATKKGRLNTKEEDCCKFVDREEVEKIILKGRKRQGIIKNEHLDAAYKKVVPEKELAALRNTEFIPQGLASRVFKEAEKLAGVPYIPRAYYAYYARLTNATKRKEIELIRSPEGQLFIKLRDFENMILGTGGIRSSSLSEQEKGTNKYTQLKQFIKKDGLSFDEAAQRLNISGRELAGYKRAYYRYELKPQINTP